ncbi:hypothetical protein CQA66_08920, partial [Helicobacter aurati]
MIYTFVPLRNFLATYYFGSPPTQATLESFHNRLKSYQKQLAQSKRANESEEYQKNLLRDFLIQAFEYNCNTKDRIDLAIYEDSAPKVLFEVKSLSNKSEFIGGGGANNLNENRKM